MNVSTTSANESVSFPTKFPFGKAVSVYRYSHHVTKTEAVVAFCETTFAGCVKIRRDTQRYPCSCSGYPMSSLRDRSGQIKRIFRRFSVFTTVRDSIIKQRYHKANAELQLLFPNDIARLVSGFWDIVEDVDQQLPWVTQSVPCFPHFYFMNS